MQLDPYHARLYIHTATIDGGKVYIADVSDPTNPTILSEEDTPIFGSWSLDPVRRIVFLFNGTDTTLEVYDVGDDTMTMLPGAPIDLAADYPQENSWAFQAFNVTADPWSARVFAGRTQGNLSELIAYEYDPAIPNSATTYSDWASASTMASLPDAIDLDEELNDRHVPLLFSYTPLPDALTGEVLLVGAVYDTVTTYGGVMSFDADLGPGGDCDHADGAFCMYSYWSDSSPLWFQPTDGAACLDPNRRVFVGSAVTPEAEGSGSMQFYSYDAAGNLTPWLGADGRMPQNGPYALTMACH